MADDDDLDAFFEDVQNVENSVEDEAEEPPAKKIKVASAPQHRVVAASAPAAKRSETSTITATATTSNSNPGPTPIGPSNPLPPSRVTDTKPETNNQLVPPPPPPPPPATSKPHIRSAAGKTWVDPHLSDWPDDDFRLFCGNLGNEVTDELLLAHFTRKFPNSCQRARVVRTTGEVSKGYGFVSFSDARDSARAIREMDQSWLGTRPIKVKRSQWKQREWKHVQKNKKKKAKLEQKLGGLY